MSLSVSVDIVLGQGAFGRVMRAEAIGINDTEGSTTVAVKMVKGKDTMVAMWLVLWSFSGNFEGILHACVCAGVRV